MSLFKKHKIELPYNGTSGWSGSDTSQERAKEQDALGKTSERQELILDLLSKSGQNGLIWSDVSKELGWHHGSSSGALSVLHKTGHIMRLKDTRSRCKIYVLPKHVGDRETEPHGGKNKTCYNCGVHL